MSSSDPTNSLPYNELEKVLKSFVSSNINNNTNNKKEVGGSCVKEAEAAAAKAREQHEAMIIHQNTASESSSTAPPIASSFADSTSKGEDFSSLLNDAAPMPQTLEEAMEHLNKLRTMRDSLLEEQKRNNAFVERYKAKVDKQERMATLHHIIPRQLFVREDRYNAELEKVYKWSGISDQEIADFYRRKLGNNIRQHGASSTRGDHHLYQNFRDVPDFSKVNGKNASSYSSHNSVLRDLEFMKKITGGGGSGSNN